MRSHPHPRREPAAWGTTLVVVAAQGQEGLTMLKVRNGGGKEIPLVQGKEQRLGFAGAAMRRYPTPR